MRLRTIGPLVLALGLAACGTQPSDRAVTGGLIGAGAGATGALVTGNNLGTGAIVGGLVGAAAGALTDPDDINLGDPAYKR